MPARTNPKSINATIKLHRDTALLKFDLKDSIVFIRPPFSCSYIPPKPFNVNIIYLQVLINKIYIYILC